MTKIKLCGMMQPQDVIAAAELGADYVGFILTEGFRRTVVLGTFCELAGYLDDCKSGAKKVGVDYNNNDFVTGVRDVVVASLEKLVVDYV